MKIGMKGMIIAFALCLLVKPVANAEGSGDVVGRWNLEFTNGNEKVHPTLTLVDTGGVLSGTWSGPRGTADLKDAKYAGDSLTFSFKQQMPMREVDFTFNGNVAGDKLTGKLTTPRGELPVTGTHAK